MSKDDCMYCAGFGCRTCDPNFKEATKSRCGGAGCGGDWIGAIRSIPLEVLRAGKDKEEFDPVTYVAHYQVIPEKGVEAIHIVNALLGCEEARSITPYQAACYKDVIKYTLRALKKGKFIEDLKKARTYIDFILEEEKGE